VDKLDALGDRQLRTTLVFARGAACGVTAADAARALAIPRSAARWRLEKLAEAGLLDVGFERRNGRRGPGSGRPAKTYRAAAETSAIEFPRRRSETLIGLLAEALPRRKREQRLADVGRAYAEELAEAMRLKPAATLPAALRGLCRGLGRLGFHAEVDSVSRREAILVSATCPLRPLIVGYPDAAAIDEGMWGGLITRAVAGRRPLVAGCRTDDCLARSRNCRILVTFDRVEAGQDARAS
jgi:predicted ArsR family transcriptional regulator